MKSSREICDTQNGKSFPWRKYTEKELIDEFYRLTQKITKPNKFPLPFSTIGFKFTNAFFQYERMNTPGIGRPSTIQYWQKNYLNVIKFSKKVNRDLFSTLNYFNHAPSQFPIVTAGKIYKYFGAKKILDPYAGWGDRLLGAMAVDIKYIGIDSNKNLQELFKYMLSFLKSMKTNSESTEHQLELFNNFTFASKVIINKCENVDIEKLDYDFVLTSPPFWTKDKMIERYGDIEIQRTEFMKNSLIPVVSKCFNSGVWVCLYIPEDMYNELKNIIGPSRKILQFKVTNSKIAKLYCWKKNSRN